MFNPISIFSSIDAFLHDVYSFFKFCILIDGLFFRLAKNTEWGLSKNKKQKFPREI